MWSLEFSSTLTAVAHRESSSHVDRRSVSCPASASQPRVELARIQLPGAAGGALPKNAAAGAGEVLLHFQLQPGRILEVRVAGLKQQMESFAVERTPDGLTATENLEAIHQRVRALVQRQ